MSDPYVYEFSSVLKNVLDLQNDEDLDAYENTVVNLALLKLLKEDYQILHTNQLFDTHQSLFKDVYAWAGKPRTINIEKSEQILNGISVVYEDKASILSAITNVHNQYFNKKWGTFSETSFVYEVTRYMSALWQIHPFREGNTRTVTTYLYFFVQKYGYQLNEKLLKKHASYVRNALVMASLDEYSEYQYLENILKDAIFGH
ncbi:MAG: Fic family protein, partial [Acholeplasma sp.]|nr:Fic family protein [Acholeplasma sp.]